MTITAYDRASEILISLRECILKPIHNLNEKDACNKRMKELYDELDEVCRKKHVMLFSYKHKHMGISLEPGLVTMIRTVEDRDDMHDEWGLYLETHGQTIKHPFMDMENGLISQAAEWLQSNRESLSSVTLPKNTAVIQNGVVEPPASDAEARVPTFEIMRSTTAKGNKRVKGGNLKKGQKEYLLTTRPTLALKGWIRAYNEDIEDHTKIKSCIIAECPAWGEMRDNGIEPDLKHARRELKKAFKNVFNTTVTPWHPLPFKIDLQG